VKWPQNITTLAVVGALLGTLALQVYLISQEYHTRAIRLKVDLNERFLEAVQEEKEIRVDSAVNWFEFILGNEDLVELWADTIGSPYEATRIVYHLRDSTGERSSVSFVSDTITDHFPEIDQAYIRRRLLIQARSDTEEGTLFYYTDLLAHLMQEHLSSMMTNLDTLRKIYTDRVNSYRGLPEFGLNFIPLDSIPLSQAHAGFVTLAHRSELLRPKWKVQATYNSLWKAAFWRARYAVLGGSISLLLTVGVFLVMLRTLRTQQRLARMKDEFIDNTSHELQTPIATLMAIHEGFEKYAVLEDREKTQRYLKTAKGQVQRLARLADQVLRGAQNLQATTPHTKAIQWNDFLAELELAYGHMEKVRFMVRNQYSPSTIITDPQLLRQALDNLIDNGIKYNDKEVPEVQMTCSENKSGVQIKISDNGPGIPEEEQARVFEKFYRVSEAGTHNVKGFGMGLYLVKQAIESLGGQVALHSTTDSGTSFTLTLPQNEHA